MKHSGKKGDEQGIFIFFCNLFLVERRYAMVQRAPKFDKCLILIYTSAMTNKVI